MRLCCACPAQVLGRSEFKQLLRWRLTLRKELKGDLAVAEEAAGKAKDKKGEGSTSCVVHGHGTVPYKPAVGSVKRLAYTVHTVQGLLCNVAVHTLRPPTLLPRVAARATALPLTRRAPWHPLEVASQAPLDAPFPFMHTHTPFPT